MTEKKIEWTRLGNSGLKISKIIIGFMSFGEKSWAEWVQEDQEKIFEILKVAYDHGLRTYDTADFYSNGYSEIILGEFLKKYNIKRDKVVILTKGFLPIDEEDAKYVKNGSINSNCWNDSRDFRKHIFDAIEGSVSRLGTYIDVYQIHRLDDTPKEEIMKALNDVVDKGLTRYIGASSMRAVDFAELQFTAEKNGWHKFISMQNYYNLLYREEEREMIHYCKKTNVGLLPWSPQARGLLARPSKQSTDRIKSDPTFKSLGLDNLTEIDQEMIKRVEDIAVKRNNSMSNIATAWVLSKGTTPIIGFNSVDRVLEAVAASKITLTEKELLYLEELYIPQKVVGF
ncbi:hypothetical protein WICMUC_004880 [Wickerhamomyces mucosus]|uniref:NADP-dependent oxidoreductase domain-containing protein n=1 Tax=Wickerhamomyces mucosus TaxID=1378264 RepID=A0A9P8T9S0_9ASCO|nr:hypothetical protein WICMUC_004880 [Wickerhamomyces mucosus]